LRAFLQKVFILLLVANSLGAQTRAEVEDAFKSSLSFLINSQVDSTIDGEQYAGEWPVYMELTEAYLFIGKKQKALDSDCFTISAIHNFLAEIYMRDTSLTELKPVLDHAYNEIKTYATGLEYNFWKPLPPDKNHKLFGTKKHIQLVRRPTNFKSKARLVQKMMNVTNDADDTNQANLATWYHNIIFKDTLSYASASVFEAWTDKKRQNRNWYNYLFHNKKNSGAYLTWLKEEHKYGIWTPIHSYLSVLSIFLPSSSAYPRSYEPWVPWGANDVDPIVNANVLTYLGQSGQLKASPSNLGATQMLNKMVDREMWSTAGVYYPNAFHLPYAVARAYKSGAKELQPAAEKCATFLSQIQTPNGFYFSRKWVNNRDTMQSTAYALHALLDLKEMDIPIAIEKLNQPLRYLLNHQNTSEEGTSWTGGIYFTGGTALRNIINWHSDAYTTALIAGSLQRILQSDLLSPQ
jgi:hypothetical protein